MTCTAMNPAAIPASQASARACNLVLVGNQGVNHLSDFERIRQYIADEAPDVHASVRLDQPYRAWQWVVAMRPTMVFSPVPLNRFRPMRGRLLTGQNLTKSQEYAALEAAGVPVPRYRMLTEANPRPDVTPLGQYVVVKPDRGGRGAHVRTMRATKARWEPTESRISGKSDSLLAQEFIYTGPWPVSYRVTTLFGQVLWALKVEASRTRAAMSGPEAFGTQGGLTVVSNSKGCVMSPTFDEEVIAFGEAAHRAFPNIPLLGIDIVRRATDGKLFVIEVNASGWVWHFGSPLGLRAQKEFGFRFEEQFDGIRKAARVLAAEARRQAR